MSLIMETTSQKLVKKWKRANAPDFTWEVDSKSRPGYKHTVEYYENKPSFTVNGWHCTCEGFLTRKKKDKYCRHVRILNNKFKQITWQQ